jgi:biopolymer transport protein ExbD
VGGGIQGDDDDLITGINVTPLVDIVLVLLIILMVTASYIVSKSIPMDLPDAQTGQQMPLQQFTVSINEESEIFLNSEQTTWEDLERQARSFSAQQRRAGQDARAVIEADRRVSHGEFIRVVDMLRRAEITRYAINVNPRDLERE